MPFRKRVFAAAGYNTTFMGPGRKEFNPKVAQRPFEEYLKEAADGLLSQVQEPAFDEGVIANFMASRFIKQANLPGFLPAVVPSLLYKPCMAVEGACGSGGRAISAAVRVVLSDEADAVYVTGFEIQSSMKAVYGADVLAGADDYSKERKEGHAYFFPALFAKRAGRYYDRFGYDKTRLAMASWYEQAIHNAREDPKAQEYHNQTRDLLALGMMAPDPDRFIPHLNRYDCSKVSDGASAIVIATEAGLDKLGISIADTIEILAIGGSQGDITRPPADLTVLATTRIAVERALLQTNRNLSDLSLLELHDCFSITAILSLEAAGYASAGEGPKLILDGGTRSDGKIPTNLSGGLCGFGHPVGASGIRQLVDLHQQFTGRAAHQSSPKTPYGMMISMGGNDVTVTAVIVKTT